MIRWVRYFVVAVFIIFSLFFFKKVFDFEDTKKIYAFKNEIDKLIINNHFISDEVEKIIGNRYVNYDTLISNLQNFNNILKKIENNRLSYKIEVDKNFKKIKNIYKKEIEYIEKIIQDSALIKSSFLYLPVLEKDIVLSNLKDKKVIESIQEILEILSYQILSRDERANDNFYKYIKNIKEYKTEDRNLKDLLDNFNKHSFLIYKSIKNLSPRLKKFKKVNLKIENEIKNIDEILHRYERALKKRNLIIDGLFNLILFIFVLLIFYFIYKEQKVEEELKKFAEYDYLTGLPNRYKLLKDMKNKRDKEYFIIRFDLDNFSNFNENFGTSTGDEVLKDFAKLLKKVSIDKAYRVTSDEFVIICDTDNKEDMFIFFENIKKLAKKELKYFITFSAGAKKIDKNCDFDRLIFYLQAAIFSAKKRGGDTIILYNENDPFIKEYKKLSKNGLRIRKDIEEAIKNQDFILFFQPIFDIKNEKIEKYEALIRMRKNGKVIFPIDFIEHAEKFNLIGKITREVIKYAFKKVKEKELNISINLSAIDIIDENLLDFIFKELKLYKIKPSSITFEVTETAVVQDMDKGLNFLNNLKSLGFKIAIDDFGVGYSSLKYLRDIPADYIKIDGEFIKDIDKNEKNREFVKDINEIIKSSGKKSIAEFVENEKIYKILKEIDIDFAQGYYIGKPAPLD